MSDESVLHISVLQFFHYDFLFPWPIVVCVCARVCARVYSLCNHKLQPRLRKCIYLYTYLCVYVHW